jgi:hypothetical protein
MNPFEEIDNNIPLVDIKPKGFEELYEEIPLDRFRSVLMDSPVMRTGQELEELMFSRASKDKINEGVEMISENNVDPEPFKKSFNVYRDRNRNGFADDGDRHLFKFTMKVFVSKDKSYLDEAFLKNIPGPNEICLFLEDNSTDLISGRTAMVRVSEQFSKEFLSIAEAVQNKDGVLEQVQEHFKDFDLDFTKDEIRELISTRKIENISSTIAFGIFQLVNFSQSLLSPVFAEIGKGLTNFAKFINDNVKFKDYHWNPQAKVPKAGTENNEEPVLVENTDFNPILFPKNKELVEQLVDPNEAIFAKIIQEIRTGIEARDKSILNSIDKLGEVEILTTGLVIDLTPDYLDSFVRKAYESVRDKVLQLLDAVEALIPKLSDFAQRIFNVINAFVCGLWNSLVDAITGLISLVGMIFNGMAAFGEAVKNPEKAIPRLLEQIDELIQSLSKIDFGKIATALGGLISSQITKLTEELTPEQVAYFLGGVVGFMIEIILEILFTGGTAAVAAVFRRFGNIGKRFFQFLREAVEAIISKKLLVKNAGNDFLGLLDKLIAFLKQGTEKIVEGIRKFREELDKLGEVTREAIQRIKNLFKLTDTDLKKLRDLGLDFTRIGDEFATICKVS